MSVPTYEIARQQTADRLLTVAMAGQMLPTKRREGVRRRVQRAPRWECRFAATLNGAAGSVLRRIFFAKDEDHEDYRGPVVLIATDGNEVQTQLQLLAQYQPVDDTVRWSDRVYPSPDPQKLRRNNYQPVQLRISDYKPVEALLVDRDPWGGSRIVGAGSSPYPPYPDTRSEHSNA